MVTGKLSYLPLTMPPGTIGPGTISASASGGADVDAFQSQLSRPEPIQIDKSNLLPGTQISMSKPLTVTWTGGSADLLVRVRLGFAYGRVDSSYYERSTTGDKGSLTLTPIKSGSLTYFPGVASGPGLSKTVLISPVAPRQSITVPGFDEPIPQTWTYVFTFSGLVQVN